MAKTQTEDIPAKYLASLGTLDFRIMSMNTRIISNGPLTTCLPLVTSTKRNCYLAVSQSCQKVWCPLCQMKRTKCFDVALWLNGWYFSVSITILQLANFRKSMNLKYGVKWIRCWYQIGMKKYWGICTLITLINKRRVGPLIRKFCFWRRIFRLTLIKTFYFFCKKVYVISRVEIRTCGHCFILMFIKCWKSKFVQSS